MLPHGLKQLTLPINPPQKQSGSGWRAEGRWLDAPVAVRSSGQAEELKQSLTPHGGGGRHEGHPGSILAEAGKNAGPLAPMPVSRALGKDFTQHSSCQKW